MCIFLFEPITYFCLHLCIYRVVNLSFINYPKEYIYIWQLSYILSGQDEWEQKTVLCLYEIFYWTSKVQATILFTCVWYLNGVKRNFFLMVFKLFLWAFRLQTVVVVVTYTCTCTSKFKLHKTTEQKNIILRIYFNVYLHSNKKNYYFLEMKII